jgi:hypothetical protein
LGPRPANRDSTPRGLAGPIPERPHRDDAPARGAPVAGRPVMCRRVATASRDRIGASPTVADGWDEAGHGPPRSRRPRVDLVNSRSTFLNHLKDQTLRQKVDLVDLGANPPVLAAYCPASTRVELGVGLRSTGPPGRRKGLQIMQLSRVDLSNVEVHPRPISSSTARLSGEGRSVLGLRFDRYGHGIISEWIELIESPDRQAGRSMSASARSATTSRTSAIDGQHVVGR